ncbi:hypothetical protein DSL72_001033 [Monilinia vaccinii-corymbosi]|uniref:BTB domain-containing protein n=1 Tax=Monilinia vaccinii-corymbosi TaxID=61207 RepID=A0A8A3P8Z6_9HELO|nr:hypothetical protein DSL72_001033 [Monilinia vaccinii-corymbosi]
MNNQATAWAQHGNAGHPNPAAGPQSLLQQPIAYRQYMARQTGSTAGLALPLQVGPYRSYAQVVRDYLSGNVAPLAPLPSRRSSPSLQPMSTFPSLASLIAGSPSRGVFGSEDQSLLDPSTRRINRLSVSANRREPPTWMDVSMDMVIIYIKGEDGLIDGPPFYVHKEFLTHASPYFSAAFNSGFAESHTQTLHFAESSREIFALLIQWVYKQDLHPVETFERADRQNLPPGIGLSTLQGDYLDQYLQKSQALAFEHTTQLIDLWFLGDKVLMPTLQNAALRAIETLRFFTPLQGLPADICTAIYARTAPGSPLRSYLADTTLRRVHPRSEDRGEDFPAEMLADLFDRVMMVGADARLRHYGLSERAMEAFLVEVRGGAHLKANPSANPPLADDIWVAFWELRRDAMKF